jgi:hypothetical protein
VAASTRSTGASVESSYYELVSIGGTLSRGVALPNDCEFPADASPTSSGERSTACGPQRETTAAQQAAEIGQQSLPE